MFDANIKLLQSMQFEGMDKDTRKNLMDSVTDIKTEYDEASLKAEEASLKAGDDKYYANLKESIAKSLPSIVKGALSADAAFKRGNNLAGAAALMDICESVIPVFTSLLAAGGPEGMLVGALFSMVGQILAFFAPKPPSLESKIKKMFEEFGAKLDLQKVEAVEISIDRYTHRLRKASKKIYATLKLPVGTQNELDKFRTDLTELEIGLDHGQLALAIPEFASWEVASWLKDPENYDNDKWPEILGHWCQAYSNLVTANIILKCLVNPKVIQKRLADTKETAGPLSASRDHAHTLLINLQAIADEARENWEDWSSEVLKVLQATKSNAKARGLYVLLDPNGYLWSTTGRKGFQSGWNGINYGGKNLSNGYGYRFSITVPKEEAGALKPKYHIFYCMGESPSNPRSWSHLDHAMLTPGHPVSVEDAMPISEVEYFADSWALPAPKDQTPRDPKASFVYVARDEGTIGFLKTFDLEPNSKLKEVGWSPSAKSGMLYIRAVTHPPAALLDDPDRDGLPPGSPLLGGNDHYNSIVYGGLRSSPDIFVDQQNKDYHVPSPWPSYNGIAVDDYYLWVFRPEGFVCATHASVVKCTLGKSSSPRWMSYSIPGEYLFDSYELFGGGLYSWESSRDRQKYNADKVGPLKGLVSLSPCKDGTLVASIYKRTIRHPDRDSYVANDSLSPLYTMDYNIDLKGGAINVGTLVKSDNAYGVQVQKMPIPCWTLFESLEADLRTKKTP